EAIRGRAAHGCAKDAHQVNGPGVAEPPPQRADVLRAAFAGAAGMRSRPTSFQPLPSRRKWVRIASRHEGCCWLSAESLTSMKLPGAVGRPAGGRPAAAALL